MRLLIDGYNVMFAAGLMGKRFGPDGFRKTRVRFLDDLATKLGPVESRLTTVVFDANRVPGGLPSEASHRGIQMIFAVHNPTADERINEMIRAHSDPRRLRVISSDNQIRVAARRRGSSSITADDFLDGLVQADRTRAEAAIDLRPEKPTSVSEAESAYWQRQFGELDRSGEVRAAFARDPMFPSDEEIAQIAREVEREGG